MHSHSQNVPQVSFCVDDRLDMDDQLNETVAALIPEALRLGDRGILIIRTSPTDFTVELHRDVPFGYTHERQDW